MERRAVLGYIILTKYDKSIPTAQVRRTIKLPTYIYFILNYPQGGGAKSRTMSTRCHKITCHLLGDLCCCQLEVYSH
jgi:hypothetical protein